MTAHTLSLFQWLLIVLCCAATIYALLAAVAMPRFTKRGLSGERHAGKPRPHGTLREPVASVSVLKPLCGMEPHLFENLATFCEQTHPCVQLLFGVSSAADPAIAVVRRLQKKYPRHDIALIDDPRVYGSNLKVSNLINMARNARHDVIVVADSDIAVEPDYLEQVTAPLADPRVGIVTCLYRARSIGSYWSRVGALFIDEWFAPSVRIAHAGGSRGFGFGATLALRRSTLDDIGGFEALKNCLADDYLLAEHTRRLGLETVLSPVTVATDVIERGFIPLWTREMRWLRTIRSVNPAGFAFLFVTFTSPWLLAGALLALSLHAHHPDAALGMAIGTLSGLIARVALHAREARAGRTFWRDLPLVPLRDGLLALQWLGAAFGSQVVWRGARMSIANRVEAPTASIMEMSDGG